MKNFIFVIFLVSIISINTAKADIFTSDGARAHRQLMRDMDSNNDGFIDNNEIKSSVDAAFARFDTDGDEKISKEEMFEAYGGRISDFDANQNGKVSKSEMKEYRKNKKLKE